MKNPELNAVLEWSDLHRFGINMLTGEADGIGMRLLCDVSASGAKLLADFFGLAGLTLYDPMNSGDSINGEKPVGSLFLPRDLLWDLAAFCILQDWDVAVVIPYQNDHGFSVRGQVVGHTTAEFEIFRQEPSALFHWHCYLKLGDVRGGFRNQHYWSGRIE